MDIQQFEARKRDHMHHSLDSAHQAIGLSGLDQVHLVHEALPDLNFADVQIQTPSGLRTPFFVPGMTAGHQDAITVNRRLALACQERGWSMGVGSQRRDLEVQDRETLDPWFQLRKEVPDLVLFANIGITQLIGAEISKIRRLVELLNAQALVVHTNPLQESLQPEGTPQFKGCWEALKRVCGELGHPVILKETGCGFSEATLTRIAPIGLAAVDVSGLGGTHWGRIEGARAASDSVWSEASQTFANWGEPTVRSVLAAVEVLGSKTEVWASGGVRTGLDGAKLMALGAKRVGFAKPALEAALNGSEKLRAWMQTREYEFKLALFCTGSKDCQALLEKEGVWRVSGN